jgi:glyoxylase-like metal-dependent hydrolase (beta-lactamase superfamily II)
MSNIIVITNELGSLSTNSYIAANTETREAIVIDPADDAAYIVKCLKDSKLKCTGIFLTHGHLDHMAAMDELKELTQVQTYASEDEKQILESERGNLSAMLGYPLTTSVDNYLHDGDEVKVLGTTMKCISVPGHTIGGMCYYFEEAGILFSGDTLFASSIGRSDFPTGNGQVLLESIEEKLLVLPDETIVYPGHNSRTKIGREKAYNPFFS